MEITQRDADNYLRVHEELAPLVEQAKSFADRAVHERAEIERQWEDMETPDDELEYQYQRAINWEEIALRKRNDMINRYLSAYNTYASFQARLDGTPEPNPI